MTTRCYAGIGFTQKLTPSLDGNRKLHVYVSHRTIIRVVFSLLKYYIDAKTFTILVWLSFIVGVFCPVMQTGIEMRISECVCG